MKQSIKSRLFDMLEASGKTGFTRKDIVATLKTLYDSSKIPSSFSFALSDGGYLRCNTSKELRYLNRTGYNEYTLILDEPFISLDEKIRIHKEEYAKQLLQEELADASRSPEAAIYISSDTGIVPDKPEPGRIFKIDGNAGVFSNYPDVQLFLHGEAIALLNNYTNNLIPLVGTTMVFNNDECAKYMLANHVPTTELANTIPVDKGIRLQDLEHEARTGLFEIIKPVDMRKACALFGVSYDFDTETLTDATLLVKTKKSVSLKPVTDRNKTWATWSYIFRTSTNDVVKYYADHYPLYMINPLDFVNALEELGVLEIKPVPTIN